MIRINLTAPSDLIENAKELHMNLSELFRETLENTLAIKKGDISKISIKLKQREKQVLEKKLSHLKTQLDIVNQEIAEWNKLQESKETERLSKEADRLQKVQFCRFCGVDVKASGKKYDMLKDGTVAHQKCILEPVNYKKLKEEGLV